MDCKKNEMAHETMSTKTKTRLPPPQLKPLPRNFGKPVTKVEEKDLPGFVTSTSNDIFVASTTINGSITLLPFTKSKFYFFGMKCDGDTKNVLEVGTKVNVCCKYTRLGNRPFIALAWLGVKPEGLDTKETLKAVYGVKGYVVTEGEDCFLVEKDDDDITVLVNKGVFNLLEDEELALKKGQVVMFDAIPFKFAHPSGALLRATSAWLEDEPKLIDRFGLQASACENTEEEFEELETVRGRVVVVPNDIVAFVEEDCTGLKIMLLRKSFGEMCGSIKEKVAVGDVLCMTILFGFIYPGTRQWYAERAWKEGEKYEADIRETVQVSLNTVPNENVAANLYKRRVTKRKTPKVLNLPSTDTLVSNTLRKSAIQDIKTSKSATTDEKRTNEANCNERPVKTDASKWTEVVYDIPPCEGYIYSCSVEDCAFIDYGNYLIGVKLQDVFIDGCACTVEQFQRLVKSGDNVVMFEAIPTVIDVGVYTHDATCVWIGDKPSLEVVASTVDSIQFSLLKDKNRTFVGCVAKYYLPDTAIIAVEKPEKTSACLHVKTLGLLDFASGGEYVSDVVKCNEYFEFKLRWTSEYPDIVSAYDIKKFTEAAVTPAVTAPMPASPAPVRAETPPYPVGHYEATPFQKVWRKSNRTFFLNCLGCLTIERKSGEGKLKISFALGTATVSMDDPMLLTLNKYKPLDCRSLIPLIGTTIRFDAGKVDDEIVVKRIWRPDTLRPSPAYSLTSELKYSGTKILHRGSFYVGTVISIPLHDTAIALVTGVPVLVILNSLVVRDNVNPNLATIEMFLRVDDEVVLMTERLTENGLTFYQATKCWMVSGVRKSDSGNDQFEITDPDSKSWLSVWQHGEILKKCRVVASDDGRYCVESASSGCLVLKNNVFLDGYLIDVNTVDCEGLELTCFITGDTKTVVCAWVGEQPSPLTVLKDKLQVPEDVIYPSWVYEAVVDDIPFPHHVICKIGVVRVLIELTPVEGNPNLVAERNLKVGDIVTVRLQKEKLEKMTYLVGKIVSAHNVFNGSAVRMISGTIAELPRPVGKIKARGIDLEAVFDLSTVCRKGNLKEGEVLSWFDHLKKRVLLGSQVCFSAVATSAKTNRYRAYEVYIDDV